MTRLTGRDPATGRVLRVDTGGGLITEVTEVTEATGRWIAPGLIDLQVNGYHGFDVNEAELRSETVTGLVRTLQSVGVTTIVPTLITAPEDQLLASLATIAGVRKSAGSLAHAIPHVHVEGPFLSEEEGPRGVHDPRHIRPPDAAEVRRWQRASGGLVGMVTVSPHWPGSAQFIRAVTGLGIRVAIGHTHATPGQVHEAVAAGATVSTHLGNGAHASLSRHPNYLWAQLAADQLRVGFIADGHHLPADTFKAMVRAVGLDRAHLVSDATALAGMPPGRYRTTVGDLVELSPAGRLSPVGSPYLAGAARGLHECTAIATGLGGLTLGRALGLAIIALGEVEMQHLDLAINVYAGEDRQKRFAQSLQHGKVQDASFRTHLFRIDGTPFVSLFSFCEMFLESKVLLSEWFNELVGA